ncbi:MAG: hypothetical protein ACK55Z_25950 [bacterium]
MIGSTVALKLRKNDLPHDADLVEKVDPLSRYVNDDDIVQIEDDVSLVQLKKNDLPHDADLVEKLDPLSRYVNDDDIL